MPAPFKKITRDQFAELIAKLPFTRQINAVHMHHTWRPRHKDFKGHESIVAMWRHHTQVNGWSDIAQHITIDPQGEIWLGRNWNLPPCSAAGHNGNARFGPFMFEMIGDFDSSQDRFEGEQKKTVLEVIARVQKRFKLPPESLKFHNAMSSKTCPGSGIDFQEIVAEVRKLQETLPAVPAPRALGPFGPEMWEIQEALGVFRSQEAASLDASDAELHCQELPLPAAPATASREGPRALTPETLSALRPHIVNLNMGQFSQDGETKTAVGDVDVIFENLAQELKEHKQKNEKLRIVFFAHGGLTSESAGLEIAGKHVSWWKENRIYPLYFIWETGLFEIIGQLLRRAGERGRRALARDFWDHTTDPLIAEAVRRLGGPPIWGGMKQSAELGCAEGKRWDAGGDPQGREGGARYVARKLAQFCTVNAEHIELHAVGHSAGSIFHAHFLDCAAKVKTPAFKSVHLLAPAIRVDTFLEKYRPLMDSKFIEHLSVFTMRRDIEENDDCIAIYQKSLLYLLHHALERERKTPILGLEISIRGDPIVKELLGLADPAKARGEVIWSISPARAGRSASASTSHGGFDDDAPTMNSVALRILGKQDADRIVEYKPAARALSFSEEQVDWPPAFQRVLPAAAPTAAPFTAQVPIRPATAGAGRKLALCVGIDEYPTAPLAGCVADAELWEATLKRFGFDARLFRNGEAVRERILRELDSLVSASRPGDVIVFQYAGHGTQLPDLDGDEVGEDTPDKDEALVPFDYERGAFLIDDDIADVFARLPEGVNLTCFMDCCHSGTNTRFAVGANPGAIRGGTGERRRFMVASREMIAAHEAFRASGGARRGAPGSRRGPDTMREVTFSACQSTESAWESNGHGEFTLRAVQVLDNGVTGLSNEKFFESVTAAFGAAPRQHPWLDCAQTARARTLLQALDSAPAAVTPTAGEATAALGKIVETLQTLTQQLQAWRG